MPIYRRCWWRKQQGEGGNGERRARAVYRVGVRDEEFGRFGAEPVEPRRVRDRRLRGLQLRFGRSSPVRAPVVVEVFCEGRGAPELVGKVHGGHEGVRRALVERGFERRVDEPQVGHLAAAAAREDGEERGRARNSKSGQE